MFTKDLIQAISNWQRGWSGGEKQELADALKHEAISLPDCYKTADIPCYRRMDLSGKHLNQMGLTLQLKESISSWTTSREIALKFKDIPKFGEALGTVFEILPPRGSVIINLPALFAEKDFLHAVSRYEGEIDEFDRGIGLFGDTEKEVIIELGELPLTSVVAWGGHSSSQEALDSMMYSVATIINGRPPSDEEFDLLVDQMKKDGIIAGAQWISGENGVARIADKLMYHANRLNKHI